jgi:hypothetical protein
MMCSNSLAQLLENIYNQQDTLSSETMSKGNKWLRYIVLYL